MLATTNVCELPAPPAFVWPLYTEPSAWTRWSADILKASVDGRMVEGAKGRCRYRLLPTGTFTVTQIDKPRSFTLDWETLWTHVVFQHELRPMGKHGTHVCERISFHGLLAPILGLLERPRIRTHWPRAMDCLGTLALEAYRTPSDAPATRAPAREPSAGPGAGATNGTGPETGGREEVPGGGLST